MHRHPLSGSILVCVLLQLAGSYVAEAQELDWVGRIGGLDDDRPRAVALDGAGNTYVLGAFTETADFDPGNGIFNLTARDSDVFVAKFDPAGDLIWARQFVSDGFHGGGSIAVDGNDNLIVAGSFFNPVDFDPGPGTVLFDPGDSRDAFVLKLDSSGDLIWARQFASSDPGGVSLGSLTVARDGSLYLSGGVEGVADIDPGPATQLVSSADGPGLLVKLSEAGGLVWFRQLEESGAMRLDRLESHFYMFGGFRDVVDFDPGPGVFNLTSAGDLDVFVAKLDIEGNFVWAGSIGGPGFDFPAGFAVDVDGNMFALGNFVGAIDVDPGPGMVELLNDNGGFHTFIVKVDPDGILEWARQIGGFGFHWATAEAATTDEFGSIYFTGRFTGSADFDPGPDEFILSAVLADAFVCKLDSNGDLAWAIDFDGDSNGKDIEVMDNARVVVVGEFSSTTDFDPGPDVFEISPYHDGTGQVTPDDGFILSLEPSDGTGGGEEDEESDEHELEAGIGRVDGLIQLDLRKTAAAGAQEQHRQLKSKSRSSRQD